MRGELSLPRYVLFFSLPPILWTHYQQLHGMRNAARGMVFRLKSTGINWLTQSSSGRAFLPFYRIYNAFTMSNSQPVKLQLQPELYPIAGDVSRCHSAFR